MSGAARTVPCAAPFYKMANMNEYQKYFRQDGNIAAAYFSGTKSRCEFVSDKRDMRFVFCRYAVFNAELGAQDENCCVALQLKESGGWTDTNNTRSVADIDEFVAQLEVGGQFTRAVIEYRKNK